MMVKRLLNISVFFFIGLFSFSSYSQNVFDSPAQTTPYKAYRIYADASYFEPASRFDLDGNTVAYNDEEDYQLIESDLKLSYGWSRQLEFFGGVRLRMVESFDAQGESLSNSGLESYFGGLKYGLPRWVDDWTMAVELSYRQTAYTNEEFPPSGASGENIILGDDGSSFKAGLHLTRDQFFFDSQFRAYLTYHRPPNELSQEILYDFSINFDHSNWVFAGGVQGIASLGLDEFESAPESKPSMNTGVTNLFNSINRQKVEPYLSVGLQLGSNSHINFKASQVMQGRSTDEGIRFLGGITITRGGVSDSDIKVESFKEYTLEASVIKVSPRGAFVQIDKGVAQDVEKGMRFDIYQTDYFGGNVLVASGVVYESSANSAIIRLSQIHNEMKIEPGFRARGQ